MEEVEYWKRRATSASDEYDELVEMHRDQTAALRRQCAELLHERSLMKAATASDVRAFVLNYQADALRRSGGAHTSATDAVPVNQLLRFLHEYSNGILPAPRSERKRNREDDATVMANGGSSGGGGGVTPQRLYHRLMLRRRQNNRECEMEEWLRQQQHTTSATVPQPDAALLECMDGEEGLSASSDASHPLVQQQGAQDAESIAAQLMREERERQQEDQRAYEAQREAPLVSVGGHEGRRAGSGSFHGPWGDARGHESGSPQ